MKFHIRPAKVGDAPALARLGASTFALACYADTPRCDIDAYIASELTAERFRGHISSSSTSIIIATQGAEVCGYLMLCREQAPAGLSAKWPLELRRIYVEPGRHGSGIADDLMSCAIRQACEAGHDSIRLSVATENLRALAFYRRHGFREIDRCDFPLGVVVYQGLLLERRVECRG